MKKNILTLFGLGKTPFSATTSSLIALTIFLVVQHLSFFSFQIHTAEYLSYGIHGLIAALVFLWSIIEIKKNADYASSDPKEIIVDEFLGMYCCCVIANTSGIIINLILFVLFRVIDIFKPFPFSAIEKKLNGRYGLLWDDIIIGMVIAAVYRILLFMDLL